MGDEYTVGDPDGLSPLLVEIRNAVARELYAQLALRNELLELADVPEVSYAVTTQIDRLLTSRYSGDDRLVQASVGVQPLEEHVDAKEIHQHGGEAE